MRSNCRVPDVQVGTCANGPDGGVFKPGSDARLTLQVMISQTGEAPHPASVDAMRALGHGAAMPAVGDEQAAALIIRFTTDGSTPTPASAAYVPGAPPRLSDIGTAFTVKAMAWINDIATEQVVTTMWKATL